MKWVHKWMNELVKFMAKESEWVSVWMWEWARERVNNRLLWCFHFVALVFLVCYLHCLVWLTFGFFSCVVYFRLYFSVSGFLSVPVCMCVCVTSVSVGQCHRRRLVIIIVIVVCLYYHFLLLCSLLNKYVNYYTHSNPLLLDATVSLSYLLPLSTSGAKSCN